MGWVRPRPVFCNFDGPDRTAAYPRRIGWAEPSRGPYSRSFSARAGPRPMRCGLNMGCSARPMRRLMYCDGPTRTAAHGMWCTAAAATTTTTSTVPMRPPTCFDWPARAVAHEMWYSIATSTTFLGVCAWAVIRQKQLRSYDAFLANRLGCIKWYNALCKCRIKALVPL